MRKTAKFIGSVGYVDSSEFGTYPQIPLLLGLRKLVWTYV